jgi:predicted NACHT family NTPase
MLARSVLTNNAGVAADKLCLQEPLPIPVFVSCWEFSDFLKNHSTVRLAALLDFLSARLTSNRFAIGADELRTLLEAGNCCLLFDGLDEVPTDSGRVAVSRLLEESVKQFPKNRYIVTSRIRAYTGDTILRGEFTRCDIQPFDANDRAQFLKNWVGLLFRTLPEKVLVQNTDPNRQNVSNGVVKSPALMSSTKWNNLKSEPGFGSGLPRSHFTS